MIRRAARWCAIAALAVYLAAAVAVGAVAVPR